METKIKKILIAPLDWGLGHATRCIPLIRMFILQRKEMVIASSGDALVLLRTEFPNLTFLTLPAYDIHYKYDSMALNMAVQIPKISSIIRKENIVIQQYVENNTIDLIISDNRYGVYHSEIPSVFIGHQLAIQMPKNMQMFAKTALKWHAKMLKSFNQIWIPDFEGEPNLSGALSHNTRIKKEVFFIGPLSRFEGNEKAKEHISLLIILSGQEPQRSIFEEIILEQITIDYSKVVLVRGLPNEKRELSVGEKDIKVYNHLPSKELEVLIASASNIVCRSGYSSIMDMAAMKKRVLLVPTPGQTEQEYLANYLSKSKLVYATAQNELNLSDDLQRLSKYKALDMQNNDLEVNIEQALNRI